MQQRGQGSGIVTPEAVRLEFQPAGIGSRALALLLDGLLQLSALFVIAFAAGVLIPAAGAGFPEWVGVTMALLLVFAVFWGYPVALETLWRGRTLGKAAMGLRVVTVEGAPVRFRHAAIRALLTLVDFWLTSGAGAVLSALLTPRHQRLGDLAAGTMVLRERVSGPPPVAVRFGVPPGAEGYAATLDPAGISSDDYQKVRTFLLRAGALDPRVRADLAVRLAQPLAQRIGHAPPAQVSPELFLVCLAARYQERGMGTPPPAALPPAAPSPPPAAPPPAAPPSFTSASAPQRPPERVDAGEDPPAPEFAPPG
ncbi:MAG TPA: RDD family protein [Egibacteraceae bacterium]|nr:RDD family protein [Egibacteraceae bacterium]